MASATGGPPRGVKPLSSREFAGISDLVRREAGIHLSDVKRALVVGRLSKRLRELGLASFGEYYDLVLADPAERILMLDSICTNETHFFREPRQFEHLERQVFPAWVAAAEAGRRPRRARVWSAACSTGEEPYSLAMALLSSFPPGSGWDVEVLASDLSTKALDRARAALWPIERSREIPAPYLRRFMLRGVGAQEGRMKAGPELQATIRFQRVNLNDTSYPVPRAFDLILCRNVLIYFQPESKLKVVERLLGHLSDDGRLLLGHAESLAGLTDRVRSVGPNVYAPSRPVRAR